MTTRILVIGAGFAGMWSALGAVRLLEQEGRNDVEVALVAPEPFLHIRPRLYEANPETLKAPLQELFDTVGVRFIAGRVNHIDVKQQVVDISPVGDMQQPYQLSYDRLVLAAGSRLFCPPVPGLQEHAFNVDQIADAARLEAHIKSLAEKPASKARNTVVVAGAGFTGLEIATELPGRLREVLGDDADLDVILVDRNDEVGPDLGAGPRPTIIQALTEQGIRWKTGSGVVAITDQGVTLENGEQIAASTVIWTAGARASELTSQIPAERDRFGRLHVDANLKVKGLEGVFATGDCAMAATDNEGNHTMMSCQHALFLGRISGHNVAADLLGIAPKPYSQPRYVTCLSLGPWGAMYSEGWQREVKMVREEAGALKKKINTQWIYPPQGSKEEILAAAAPQHQIPNVQA